MKRCKACDATYGGHAAADHRTVCARVRSKGRQWWEREPGWVKDEVRRMRRRPGAFDGVRHGYWDVQPGTRLTLREISERLAKAA